MHKEEWSILWLTHRTYSRSTRGRSRSSTATAEEGAVGQGQVLPTGRDELGGSGASRSSSTSSRSSASSSGTDSRAGGSTGPLEGSASSGKANSGGIINSGRSRNSTAAGSGARGSGGRRQTPNDKLLHAGESRALAVSSQGTALPNGLNADGGPPCSSVGSSGTGSSDTSISSTSKEGRDKRRPTTQGRASGWAADFEAERSEGWVKQAHADKLV